MLAYSILFGLSLVLLANADRFGRSSPIHKVMVNGNCRNGAPRSQQLDYIGCVQNRAGGIYNQVSSNINSGGPCNQFLAGTGDSPFEQFCNTVDTENAQQLYNCISPKVTGYVIGHIGEGLAVINNCNNNLNLFSLGKRRK